MGSIASTLRSYLGLFQSEYQMTIDTLVLMVATLIFLILLWTWHGDEKVPFNLMEMLIDSKTKRVSLMKCGQALALLVSTWVIVHETRAGRLTEWLFLAYTACWAGANLGRRLIDQKKEV